MKLECYISADLMPRVPTIIHMQKNSANNLCCRACWMRKGYDNPGRVSF